MNHLDLFSGIGGFALAAESVWPDIKHTFVEYDPFCQAVLKKHWPEAEIHGDIRAFVADTNEQRRIHGQSQEQPTKGSHEAQRQSLAGPDAPAVHLLTGGFPCQPFSHAGRRKGTADDRYLWPPMLECISLFRPRWVIAENVAGLVSWNDGMVLETVCSDLEKEGYEVQPFVIPAVAVGAPHRRDRVWIVANRRQQCGREGRGEELDRETTERSVSTEVTQRRSSDAPDSTSERGQQQPEQQATGQRTGRDRESGTQGGNWNENWPTVAARLCTLDDGLPGGLVRPKGWRNAALKAAGNAIVPQVAMEIMRKMN